MRTFKKIAGFIIVNLIVVVSLTFMLAQPSVLKILLKEAKSEECDTLIIGESHGETSYNPYVMSDVTGDQVFNLSRRLMPVVNLSYIMEEANANGQYKWYTLFDGLEISKETTLCDAYKGKFPVVFVSLKGVDGLTFENAYTMMKTIIRTEASRHYYLKTSEKVSRHCRQKCRFVV